MGWKARLKSLFGQNPPVATESALVNEDFAFSRGDAEGYVVGNTALAMAKSPHGAAVAWTDGITPRIEKEGNGTAGVTGGTAWAKAGRGNLSIVHSKEAQRRADRLISRPPPKRRTTPNPLLLPEPSPKPSISQTPLPLRKPLESPRPPPGRRTRRNPAQQQRNRALLNKPDYDERTDAAPVIRRRQGRSPDYERISNADIIRRHREERKSSNWQLHGRESEFAVTDGSSIGLVRSGQYVLTNGREAAFLERTQMGYMDNTGGGYLESTRGGYMGGGEISYIESTEGGYYSD